MVKNIYVQSIRASRESHITLLLYEVSFREFTKRDVRAFMDSLGILNAIKWDSSIRIIIADKQTRDKIASELEGHNKNDFEILEKDTHKYISVET